MAARKYTLLILGSYFITTNALAQTTSQYVLWERSQPFYGSAFFIYDNPFFLILIPLSVFVYFYIVEQGGDDDSYQGLALLTALITLAVIAFLWFAAYFTTFTNIFALLAKIFVGFIALVIHLVILFIAPLFFLFFLKRFFLGLHFMLFGGYRKMQHAKRNTKKVRAKKKQYDAQTEFRSHANGEMHTKAGKNRSSSQAPKSEGELIRRGERGEIEPHYQTSRHFSRFTENLSVKSETKVRRSYAEYYKTSADAVAAQTEFEGKVRERDTARIKEEVFHKGVTKEKFKHERDMQAKQRQLEKEDINRRMRRSKGAYHIKKLKEQHAREIERLRDIQERQNTKLSHEEYIQAFKDLEESHMKERQKLQSAEEEALRNIEDEEERRHYSKRHKTLLRELDDFTDRLKRDLRNKIMS